MPDYQLLRCMVALGGDKDNVVARGRGRPIAYPELPVLQSLHGDDAITEIAVLGTCNMSAEEMTTRLRVTYGDEAVQAVYPGRRPRLPLGDPSLPPCLEAIYVPRPTRPDNPDPVLRPLAIFTPGAGVEVIQQQLAAEAPPTDEEIARNVQFDEGPTDELTIAEFEERVPNEDQIDLAHAIRPAVPAGQAGPGTRPSVQDLPQTRTSFGGKARQARDTPTHLPDVDQPQRPRRPGDYDHDRPRG